MGIENSGFELVATLPQIPAGGVLIVTAGEREMMLFRLGDKVSALAANCTHAFASLRDGRISGTTITCAQHGARFDLMTGRALGGTCPNLPAFEVRMRGDQVLVKKR